MRWPAGRRLFHTALRMNPGSLPNMKAAGLRFDFAQRLPSASLPSTLLRGADSSTLLTVPEPSRREQSRGV